MVLVSIRDKVTIHVKGQHLCQKSTFMSNVNICHLSHLADPLDFQISQIHFDIFQISVVSVPVTGTGTIYIYIYIYINKSLLFFF
jgi:hypothetical protein